MLSSQPTQSQPTQCCSVTMKIGDCAGKIIFCPSTLIPLRCRAIGLQGYSVVNNPEQYLLGGKGAPGSITSPLCNRSVQSVPQLLRVQCFLNTLLMCKIIYTLHYPVSRSSQIQYLSIARYHMCEMRFILQVETSLFLSVIIYNIHTGCCMQNIC